MTIYPKEVMKHFTNPKNVGRMRDYDGLGKAGNLTCGDIMYLYIKISENKKGREIINDISFETFGCTIAIANTSLLTTLAKEKTLEEALKITEEDLIKRFGGVPIVKIHCSLLAVDALGEAIYDYLAKNKRPIPKELQKRHRRVEKDKEIIEKRYKALVKLEREIHKKSKAR